MTRVAVIDIGKTNAKLALVDTETGAELSLQTTPNRVIPGPPYPHFDTEGVWAFLLAGLSRLEGVQALSITTHGASAALLAADGTLACPVLDYEHDGPDSLAADYTALRPGFAATGSPRLPMGLNLGAQLHWLLATQAGLAARVAHVVTYPQYWAHRLTGVLACDVTSLGCHTDLWLPRAGEFSPLVERLGLAGRMAPPCLPGRVLGPVLPAIAAATGLPPETPVACGIHDSNASLLPHLAGRTGAFSVVSTGTWVITMAMGAEAVPLDPARDTLVNVNAHGAPVPSARFMGGREYDLMGGAPGAGSEADVASVLGKGILLLPAVVQGSGPFPDRTHRWTLAPTAGEAEVALGHYLALMTATCLTITGAAGDTVVEGPFAQNPHYLGMLASATGRAVIPSASRTGTAMGAAMLIGDGARHADAPAVQPDPVQPDPVQPDPALAAHAARWRAAVSPPPASR